MFRWILLVVCILAALSGLALGVMNPEPVLARLPGLHIELALGSLLVMALAVGVILGFVACLLLFYLPARLARPQRSTGPEEARLPERNA
ncbi:MAG: hypothetical protein JJU31_00730 [Wenzhouxiangella sp.]|nr:hypothetical protein [Wenzhouxiangella sp.]TVR95979.1 MAG: hypothetical protein EA418_06340 [Wenzhouxiangellaceae bacterium]